MYLHLSLSYLHFAQKLPSFFHRAARSLSRHWHFEPKAISSTTSLIAICFEFLWISSLYCLLVCDIVAVVVGVAGAAIVIVFPCVCFFFGGKALQLVTLNVKCTCCELRSPASVREREREWERVCVSYQIGNVTYEWYMLSRGNCLLNIAHTPHVSAQITSVCARFCERVQNWFRAYLKLCQCTLPSPSPLA